MKINSYLLHCVSLVVALSIVSLLLGEEPVANPQESKVRLFLARIDNIRKGGNDASLRSLIDDLEKEWQSKKDADYYRILLELCDVLHSASPADADRRDLILKLLKLVTESLDAADDKPVDTEVRLMLHLQGDWDYPRSESSAGQWPAKRQVCLRRWLMVWRHLRDERAKWEKKVGGPVRLNVSPPSETGLPPGIAPSAIKNPVLRKKYEDALAENSRRAMISRMKSDLKNLEMPFTFSAKRYIINAYSKPPFATDELEKNLDESGLDANIRTEIVNEVKKQVAARTEREAKQPPSPRMKITEPVPPPDAPTHHADPRLRVKVSFDLKSPKVNDVLNELRTATKVGLTHAEDIQNRYPTHGSLSYRNVPAWQVMDDLAASKRVEGRWEKEGSGYRLVRNDNPMPTSGKRSSQGRKLPFFLGIIFLVLVFVFLAFRALRGKRKQQNSGA